MKRLSAASASPPAPSSMRRLSRLSFPSRNPKPAMCLPPPAPVPQPFFNTATLSGTFPILIHNLRIGRCHKLACVRSHFPDSESLSLLHCKRITGLDERRFEEGLKYGVRHSRIR